MLVVNAVALLAVQGVRPAVSYRALELGASAASLGLIAASFSVLAVVLAIPLGGGIDPHRERWYMIGGSALIAVSSALLPVITSVVGLAVDQAMLGLGYLLVVLAGQTSVARIFPPGQRQHAYGLFTVAGGIGALLGPLGLAAVASGPGNSLAGWVWSLDLVFLAAAVCGVLSTGVAAGIAGGRVAASSRWIESGRPGDEESDGRRFQVSIAIAASVVVLVSSDLVVVYLPALGTERGLPANLVGLMLSVKAAATMSTRMVMGRLSHALGTRRLLYMSMLAAAIGLAVLPILSGTNALLASSATIGVGLGVGQPLTMAWIADTANAARRSRALATRLAGNRLGQLVVPVLASAVAGAAGVAGVFWASTAMLVVMSIVAAGQPDP